MGRARLTTAVVLALPALAGCYHSNVREDVDGPGKTPPAITRNAQAGPCADTSYQRMKGMPVDSLSPREYEIFRQRDAACFTAQAAPAPAAPQRTGQHRTNLLIFGGAAALLLGLVIAR